MRTGLFGMWHWAPGSRQTSPNEGLSLELGLLSSRSADSQPEARDSSRSWPNRKSVCACSPLIEIMLDGLVFIFITVRSIPSHPFLAKSLIDSGARQTIFELFHCAAQHLDEFEGGSRENRHSTEHERLAKFMRTLVIRNESRLFA